MKVFGFLILSILCSSLFANIVIEDDVGNTINLDHPAHRIISLAPNITELLYEIHAGDQIIAVSQFSHYPQAALTKPEVASAAQLNLEKIIRLQPDLVIALAHNYSPQQIKILNQFHIAVYQSRFSNLNDMSRNLLHYGKLTGQMPSAIQQVKQLKQQLTKLKQQYSQIKPWRYVLILWQKPLMSANNSVAITQVLTLCQGVNLYQNNTSNTFALSPEMLIVQQPDVILNAAPKLENPLRNTMKSIVINPDQATRFTPRVLSLAEHICDQIN